MGKTGLYADVMQRPRLHRSVRYANPITVLFMMTSLNGNIFRVAGPLYGEFTGHKGQWRGDLVFSLIWAWRNGWVNNREAGDLRRHSGHYDVTVMWTTITVSRRVACPCRVAFPANFSAIWKKMHLKMPSAKCRSFCQVFKNVCLVIILAWCKSYRF